MKLYEDREFWVKEKFLGRTVCDICKKEIHKTAHYEVTTGHHDWGNDSIESINNSDICSDDCLKVVFGVYLEGTSDSKYINIEMGKP